MKVVTKLYRLFFVEIREPKNFLCDGTNLKINFWICSIYKVWNFRTLLKKMQVCADIGTALPKSCVVTPFDATLNFHQIAWIEWSPPRIRQWAIYPRSPKEGTMMTEQNAKRGSFSIVTSSPLYEGKLSAIHLFVKEALIFVVSNPRAPTTFLHSD